MQSGVHGNEKSSGELHNSTPGVVHDKYLDFMWFHVAKTLYHISVRYSWGEMCISLVTIISLHFSLVLGM